MEDASTSENRPLIQTDYLNQLTLRCIIPANVHRCILQDDVHGCILQDDVHGCIIQDDIQGCILLDLNVLRTVL